MSLLHALRHETKPVASFTVPRELDLTPATPVEHVPDTRVSVEDNSTPRDGQPVFERTLPSRTTKSRRVVITTLLVLANLVQVQSGPSTVFIKRNTPILTKVDDSQFCRHRRRKRLE